MNEKVYDQSKEPEFFAEALRQIRSYGAKRFSSQIYVAVIIMNEAEHTDASTFEKANKVGAMFSLGDIFDSSKSIQELVAKAALDRKPFVYDPAAENTDKQQKWVIVERQMESLKGGGG